MENLKGKVLMIMIPVLITACGESRSHETFAKLSWEMNIDQATKHLNEKGFNVMIESEELSTEVVTTFEGKIDQKPSEVFVFYSKGSKKIVKIAVSLLKHSEFVDLFDDEKLETIKNTLSTCKANFDLLSKKYGKAEFSVNNINKDINEMSERKIKPLFPDLLDAKWNTSSNSINLLCDSWASRTEFDEELTIATNYNVTYDNSVFVIYTPAIDNSTGESFL